MGSIAGGSTVAANLNVSDIEIGAVEIKDGASDARATVSTAGNVKVDQGTCLDKTNDSITNYPIGCSYAIIDLATDAATVVCATPCVLVGVWVDVVMSAHACPIIDNATTVLNLAASTAAGTMIMFPNVTFATNLSVNSNDSATGTIVVFYRTL